MVASSFLSSKTARPLVALAHADRSPCSSQPFVIDITFQLCWFYPSGHAHPAHLLRPTPLASAPSLPGQRTADRPEAPWDATGRAGGAGVVQEDYSLPVRLYGSPEIAGVTYWARVMPWDRVLMGAAGYSYALGLA